MKKHSWAFALLPVVALIFMAAGQIDQNSFSFLFGSAEANSQKMIAEGRHTFRFDTFGDEAFWGDTLQLHSAIEGDKFGGVGPGLSPKTALSLGLKVDIAALLRNTDSALETQENGSLRKRGLAALESVDLDDPAVTLALLRANAVVGL